MHTPDPKKSRILRMVVLTLASCLTLVIVGIGVMIYGPLKRSWEMPGRGATSIATPPAPPAGPTVAELFAERGGPYRLLELAGPQSPQLILDKVDFTKLAEFELTRIIADRNADPAQYLAATYQLVHKYNRGRADLAFAYTANHDLAAAQYWLQEAIVQEGALPRYKDTLTQVMKALEDGLPDNHVSQLFKMLEATESHWSAEPRQIPKVYLPANYNLTTPLATLFLLHPSFSNPDFYDEALCNQLANQFQVAVVVPYASWPCGTNRFAWSEDKYSEFADDAETFTRTLPFSTGHYIQKNNSYYLVGCHGSAFVAFGLVYTHPDQFAGAVMMYPELQTQERVGMYDPEPSERLRNLRCASVAYADRDFFGKHLNTVLKSQKATTDLKLDHSATAETITHLDPDSPYTTKLINRIQWMLDR